MIKEKVKNTIVNNGLIEKNEHIVIGLSGGPDSVCLFHILFQLRNELGIQLHAVHINHGLRPGAADEDQAYAEKLCAEYAIPCHAFTFDIKAIAKQEGISSEDAGRKVRYQSFFKVANEIHEETGAIVKIAVAQNMNDQAETVMMRILRGTGTEGLCGIEYSREEKGKGIVIRPLLDVSRNEIERYCEENGLKPQIDLTNLEPIYTRNKIRLELLPYLESNFNVNIFTALNRLSRIAKEDKDYFGQRVDELIRAHEVNRASGRVSISAEILKSQHPALRNRVIMKLFESIGLSKDISSVHMEQAGRLVREGKTSSAADFSAGYAMRISYDLVEFYKKEDRENFEFQYEINIDGIMEIPELNSAIRVKILRKLDWECENEKEERIEKGIKTCRLSYDKIQACGCRPVIRTRRQGDYIRPLGMKGRKKLQDFFVDGKYPGEERDRMPLLCLGSEVIWVIGSRISENYKVEDDTERIIVLEFSSEI